MAMVARRAMRTELAHLQRLSQWFSAGYPIGSYAYSHGLEAMIASSAVRDAGTFQAWLTDILVRGAGRTDAILLAAAWRGDHVADLAVALAGSKERLAETTAQGAAFARVTAGVWGGDATALPFPVAVGLAARKAGLPVVETTVFYAQAFAANLVTIACRALPMGATEGQAVLAKVAPLCARIAQEAAASDLSSLGGSSYAGDSAAMEHETLPVRIFRS